MRDAGYGALDAFFPTVAAGCSSRLSPLRSFWLAKVAVVRFVQICDGGWWGWMLMQQDICERSKSILETLTNHWVLGKLKLREFDYLFVESEDRVNLLNSITGGAFLYDVQQTFWDDLMLCVTRLTDPLKTGRHENLTVQSLKALPEVKNDEALSKELRRRVDAAIAHAEPCRNYRNKRISHLDLQSVISAASPKPVRRASIAEVKATLDEIHGCLNAVHKWLLNTELMNSPPIGRGRSRVFDLNSKQLAEAIQFVDFLIDPTGQLKFTDEGAVAKFLNKLDQPVNRKNIRKMVRLRELALIFNTDDE